MQYVAGQREGRLARFFSAPWSIRLHLLHTLWRRVLTGTFYRALFAEIGAGSVIYRPLLLANTECMRLGRRVLVRGGARLEVVRHGQEWTPSLEIGNDVNIEQNVHIALPISHRGYVLEQGQVTLEDAGPALLDNPHVRVSYLGA